MEIRGIERKLLYELKSLKVAELEQLSKALNEDIASVMRASKELENKGLVKLHEEWKRVITTTEKGRKALEEGFPEKLLVLGILKSETNELEKILNLVGREANIALGWAIRRGWVKIEERNGKKTVALSVEDPRKLLDEETEEEKLLKFVSKSEEVSLDDIKSKTSETALNNLRLRGLISEYKKRIWYVEITEEGQKLVERGIPESEKGLSEITPHVIKSGVWKKIGFKKYKVEASGPKIYPGKRHPLREIIDKIRRIFLEMGFKEARGPIVESSFWCFDALFQPQDHPARELADTFYLKGLESKLPERDLVEKVKKTHENGWITGSRGWRYEWKEEIAKKSVLRTHTTAVSARYLQKVSPPSKVFSIGKVYRNEKTDWRRLHEFFQVEGIVVDEEATFRDLLGYLSTFFRKLGFEKIRFRPAYFPYTEISVEPEVYVEERDTWLELGGAGIFRPEVTEPFGIDCPVLAWGLGLERPIMLILGMRDIRDFYKNDLNWIRELPYRILRGV